MPRRPLLLFLTVGPLVVGSLGACALVADLGDKTLGKLDGGSSSQGTTTATATATTPTTTATTDATVPPSNTFCTGIVLYASFDSKVTGNLGWSSAQTAGTVGVAAGAKFGNGVSIVHNENDALDPTSGALYLLTTSTNPWPDDVGSIALWYRQNAGTTWGVDPQIAPVLYRPVANLPPDTDLETAGLGFFLQHAGTNLTGLYQLSGTSESAVLTVAETSMAAFTRPNDFNHYFVAWNRTAVAPGPKAYYAINGGSGIEVATGTADPQPLDAGEVATGFKGITSTPWISDGPSVALRLGGLEQNAPDGVFDDVVVWNRTLSFEEAAAVYASTTSVGVACGLPQ